MPFDIPKCLDITLKPFKRDLCICQSMQQLAQRGFVWHYVTIIICYAQKLSKKLSFFVMCKLLNFFNLFGLRLHSVRSQAQYSSGAVEMPIKRRLG